MNPLRQILVHIDSSRHCLERLRIAQTIAGPSLAHITGLYAVTPWLLRYPAAMDGMGDAGAVLSDLDAEKLKRAQAQFQEASAGMSNVRWSDVELTSPYDFAGNALYADLLILAQNLPAHRDHAEGERDVADDFVPSVVLSSGKPAIVVPFEGLHLQGPIKSALIAWNASRESARALTAAMNVLTETSDVHVAMFDNPAGQDPGCSAELARYLRLHGLNPTFHLGHAPSSEAGTSLLSLAKDLGSDLLVMGCYGHSRAREWALGGATRAVLQNMKLPVLMAH